MLVLRVSGDLLLASVFEVVVVGRGYFLARDYIEGWKQQDLIPERHCPFV